MTLARRWLVSLGVLAIVVTACSEGTPVDAGAPPSSSPPVSASVLAETVTQETPTTDATTTTAAPTTTTTTAAPTTTTTAPTTTTTVPPPPTTAPPAPEPPPAVTSPAPAANPTEWVVQQGESFWSIAASIADDRAGGQGPPQAVDALWRALIDANRASLPHPANPSLLYVGTTLTIPA